MASEKFGPWLEDRGLRQVASWAGQGLSRSQIARRIGVTTETLGKWEKRFGSFKAAMGSADGRQAENAVEQALLARATGGVTTLKKPIKCKVKHFDGNTGKCVNEEEVIRYATDQVYTPPDTSAIKFYLTNQRPQQWGQKTGTEGQGSLERLLEEEEDGAEL